MSKFLEYKGYLGSIEIEIDDAFVYGRVMFIRDVVSYRADDVRGLRPAFEAAVDDYLATCAELGDLPEVPCKGSLNVRIGPALHQQVAISAANEDLSLNEWIKQACELKLSTEGSHLLGSSSAKLRTLVATSFEDVQVFENMGTENWQTQNNNQFH